MYICLDFFFFWTISDYVMKQQVLLIALLKPQFWILWNLYQLTEHQSLLLIDSPLQCSVIRYAFVTSQETSVIFELINFPDHILELQSLPVHSRSGERCFHMFSDILMIPVSSFPDHLFEFQSLPVHSRLVNARWFHHLSCILTSPVSNEFSDNCFGEWEGNRTRATWRSSVKGRAIRRIVVSAEQYWCRWPCCS